MLRYIYYRCCKHHENGKRQNKIDPKWSRWFGGQIFILLAPLWILLLSVLAYNTFTLVLVFLIAIVLTNVVEHHIERTSKNYRPPERYKALNPISMTTLAWIILPLELIYVIGAMYLTIELLVVPLHLDGLLARWLSAIF